MQQRGDRQLALAVDADVDDVLGVELEVEPAAAIRDDARGEEVFAAGVGLAAVVVEQNARRAVHLANDDPLGAVDDEGAVHRHERHVAHVDVLLLDIDDRLGLGLGIDLERRQAQGDAHRRGIGEAALAALVGVVLRVFELVMVEVEVGGAGEVHDREHRAQRLLEARDIARLLVRAEELLVALALNLDEVRHLADFVDVAEDLADSPLLRPCPAVVLRGASIALVAMCFPALCGTRNDAALPRLVGTGLRRRMCGALPRDPLQCVRSVRQPGPCPGEDGKSPGRTSPCGGAVYFWMRPI